MAIIITAPQRSYQLIAPDRWNVETVSMHPSYTVASLYFSGTDGSTVIRDEIGNVWACSGHAQIDTDQYKYSGASLLLDGTDDYVSTADSTKWFFGTGDFTIGFFVRLAVRPTAGTAQTVVAQYQDADNRWGFNIRNTAGTYSLQFVNFDGSSTASISLSKNLTALSTGTWYHAELDRSGSNWYFFADGAQIGTTGSDTSAVNNYAGSLYVGMVGVSTAGNYVNGRIDGLYIDKGRARHTADFIPPTRQDMGYVTLTAPQRSYWLTAPLVYGIGDFLELMDGTLLELEDGTYLELNP